MKIAFDVDDTLIIPSVATGFDRDTPNHDTVQLFLWFQAQGHTMIIWSGSGIDWAKTWAEKLGLRAEIRIKQKSDDVDIAFDDCDVDLGKVNVRVKRVANGKSRKEWNEAEKPREATAGFVASGARKNLIDFIEKYPHQATNVIDAAYVAGLDDARAHE